MPTLRRGVKRTVAYHLPAELVEWVRALALARGTSASYEAERLLELARRVEAVRVEVPAEERSA